MELIINWQEEKKSAYIYKMLAQHENNILHKKLFMNLEIAANDQAKIWEEKIRQAYPEKTLNYKPDIRSKLVLALVKIFGTESMHSVLSSMKIRGMSLFTDFHSEHKHTSI